MNNKPVVTSSIKGMGDLLKEDIPEWLYIEGKKCGITTFPEIIGGMFYPIYEKREEDGNVYFKISTVYNRSKMYVVSNQDFDFKVYNQDEVRLFYKEDIDSQIEYMKDRIIISDFAKKSESYRSAQVNQTLTESLAKQEILGMLFWEYIDKALGICREKKISEYKKFGRQMKAWMEDYRFKRDKAFTEKENKCIDDVYKFFREEMNTTLAQLYYSISNSLRRYNKDVKYPDLFTYLITAKYCLFMVVRQARKLIGAPELKELKITENKDINAIIKLLGLYMEGLNISDVEKDVNVVTGFNILQNTYDEYAVFE